MLTSNAGDAEAWTEQLYGGGRTPCGRSPCDEFACWCDMTSRCWSACTSHSLSWSQDMRVAKIVTLYTNKGDRNCNSPGATATGASPCWASLAKCLPESSWHNYRSSSAARVYPESQCRFRARRFSIDMIVSVRQVQETNAFEHC